jgi:hypothetical protein
MEGGYWLLFHATRAEHVLRVVFAPLGTAPARGRVPTRERRCSNWRYAKKTRVVNRVDSTADVSAALGRDLSHPSQEVVVARCHKARDIGIMNFENSYPPEAAPFLALRHSLRGLSATTTHPALALRQLPRFILVL